MAVPKSTTVPNPFPVYPVSSLRDIAADILDRTVFTAAVMAVDSAVQGFVERAANGTRAGLAIQVRGDYGTGKTHLLLFAQARLRNTWPGGAADVTVLSAPATEAPFPVWYLTVVAPLLDRLGLPRLFAKLLAAAACEVADQVPLTAELAARIREDPLEVYPLLRDGLLSRTDVERALLRIVVAIAPRGSEELRAILAAMAWPQRQDAALRWLAGRPLDLADRELLGVTRDLDADAEAEAVLVAIAGAATRGGGVLALMVDEFEHLMAEDQRTNTQRNATWVKRLLEGTTSLGALVVVAGHWRAWDQLPDFKARFAGQPPIDLVTLTGKETGQIAVQYAPRWGARLDEGAAEAIAEAGGRNIRRVLALLHQLHADTVDGSEAIGAAAVRVAAETRRQLASETGRPDAVVEEAVRTAGGQVTRNEVLFGRLQFDILARRDDELRLVADVRHVATSAELTRLLEDFSIAVSALRTRHPSARGLLVATGAVDRATLALLDAVTTVEALPGEGPGWEAALRGAVTAAFEADPIPAAREDETVAQEEAARDALREARVTHDSAAAETRARLDAIDFGPDERGGATRAMARESTPTESTSVYGPDAIVLDGFSESMRTQTPSILSFLFEARNLLVLPVLLLTFVAMAATYFGDGWMLVELYDRILPSPPSPADAAAVPVNFVVAKFRLCLLLVSLQLGLLLAHMYQTERRAFVRYQRWGRQKLEELLVNGASGELLLRVKNRLIDAPDASGGFRRAFKYANEGMPFWLREDSSLMSAKPRAEEK